MRRRVGRRLGKDIALVASILALIALIQGFNVLSRHQEDVIRFLPAACEPFNGRCHWEDATRMIQVDLPGAELKSLQTFPVRVQLKGIHARQVTVEFQGVDMYMGYNRITLEQQPDGAYTGAAELVACVTGRMQWLAEVVIRDPSGRATGLRFHFWAS
ncbi:hypothetical protein [Mangrovitalea sediminis]|uniref:hypothetical protein n=1 Tax=Mangrovitalea sediminis TaxID=1982043 RepID=UPI000BE52F17|nr:hypothetical protein [Mangrovitalea sediminis]